MIFIMKSHDFVKLCSAMYFTAFHIIPVILYLFCSYLHICQYISYLEIRTGEYPPNFRLLSTSSSFFILNRSFQKGAGAFPYLILRLQPPIPANDIIITLYEKKVKCLQEVVAVGSYLATPYNYSQNSTLTNNLHRFFQQNQSCSKITYDRSVPIYYYPIHV